MKRRTLLVASATSAATAASAHSKSVVAAKKLRVIVPPISAETIRELGQIAPSIELIVCGNEDEAVSKVVDAEAVYGFATPRVIRAGKKLRWVQQPSAGVEHLMEIPELVESEIVLTNMQRVYAPEIADQALGYLLAFTRDLGYFASAQANRRWSARRADQVLDELAGKTMLVIGLGGIGTEISRRAYGFGMRVLATDPQVLERPQFVDELHRPESFTKLIPRADVIASAVPLTKRSRKMIGVKEFGMMKPGCILINVSRGGVVDTDALVKALDERQIAAAGLDVTDPEPLPEGHPLWTRNVIITPHTAGQSPGGDRRRDAVFRENLRRFSTGETLLNIVDKSVGY